MKLSDFDYHLPQNLIATTPVKPRDHSRLLLLNKNNSQIEHKMFYEIVDYLVAGDVLVFNNSKVIPARLIGRKKSGGKTELLLNRPLADDRWQVMVKGRTRPGLVIEFAGGLEAELLSEQSGGAWRVRFNVKGAELMRLVDKIGLVPLPPYITKARGNDAPNPKDKQNYQTIYAKQAGSVAAPTAGFHFTEQLFQAIRDKGVQIEEITLHVGLGTFLPVKSEDISQHHMHAEAVNINAATARRLQAAKQENRRIISVGTTTCRSLEAAALNILQGRSFSGLVDIFIYPPYDFQIVDALITNFHLPKSTLLMLVSALAGQEAILSSYEEAVRRSYRFYSYGDAMFIK